MTKIEAEKIVEILDGYGIQSNIHAACEGPARWQVGALGIEASTGNEIIDHLREMASDSIELEEVCALLSSVESP